MKEPAAARAAFAALCADGFQRGDAEFRHQHAVDAHQAQTARVGDPPIGLAFALAGLCLHLEQGWDGRQVQRAHQVLAQRGRTWPALSPIEPARGLDARDALAAPAGPARDAVVRAWCEQVWAAHAANQAPIRAWLRAQRILSG